MIAGQGLYRPHVQNADDLANTLSLALHVSFVMTATLEDGNLVTHISPSVPHPYCLTWHLASTLLMTRLSLTEMPEGAP